MAEKIALACLDCDFMEIVKTPESQSELTLMVQKFKLCPDCDKPRIVQTAWSNQYGIGTP